MKQQTAVSQITLSEFETISLPSRQLTAQAGEQLWRLLDQTGKKLLVSFPSPKTEYDWQLTAQGWVGRVALPGSLLITITPKVPIVRLFQLWEVAYDLRLAHFFAGSVQVDSVSAFFNTLAQILAQQVIRRGRQGFQQAYLQQTAVLPYVRGRLLPKQPATTSPTVQLACRFDSQTTDIVDNQIIAYTLYQIARSGQCHPAMQSTIRQAYHLLQPITTLRPFQPNDCPNRSHSRLNQDYAIMHALCRFFLEHTGPLLADGTHTFLPFLLNMAQLYERCVANWLQANLPPPYRLKAQESTTLGPNDELRFQIDLTLYDGNGRALAVLDTKYKTPDKPSPADINQVITYAKAKNCHHAILIYPQPLPQPLQLQIGDVQLHTLVFGLDKPLDAAGERLMVKLSNRLNL